MYSSYVFHNLCIWLFGQHNDNYEICFSPITTLSLFVKIYNSHMLSVKCGNNCPSSRDTTCAYILYSLTHVWGHRAIKIWEVNSFTGFRVLLRFFYVWISYHLPINPSFIKTLPLALKTFWQMVEYDATTAIKHFDCSRIIHITS